MTVSTDRPSATQGPVRVVRSFLDALADEDLDAALALIDDDIAYTNVSLPTVHGRQRFEGAFRPMLGRMGFQVHQHHVAVDHEDDGVVITERTDMLVLGPVRWQFWVYGRFEVRDGRITVWRDSFDWADVLVGLVRGALGVVLPAAGRRWPGD